LGIKNTSITIPASVTSIGQQAFGVAIQLTSVTFSTGSAITYSNFGKWAFPERDGNGWEGADSLKDAYLSGGAGTYTRPNTRDNDRWTKQP